MRRLPKMAAALLAAALAVSAALPALAADQRARLSWIFRPGTAATPTTRP